jgi:hypothetical protein
MECSYGSVPNYGVYGFRVRTVVGFGVGIRSPSPPGSGPHVAQGLRAVSLLLGVLHGLLVRPVHSECVGRAPHASAAPVEDVRIDHGRLDVIAEGDFVTSLVPVHPTPGILRASNTKRRGCVRTPPAPQPPVTCRQSRSTRPPAWGAPAPGPGQTPLCVADRRDDVNDIGRWRDAILMGIGRAEPKAHAQPASAPPSGGGSCASGGRRGRGWWDPGHNLWADFAVGEEFLPAPSHEVDGGKALAIVSNSSGE